MLTGTQDNDEIIERVAALDIGKAELVCCVRVPDPKGGSRRLEEVKTYSTMTRSLQLMADRLLDLGVTRVVMEATSDYWRSPFYLLEAHGFEAWLVNARDVKNLPGRPKTDLSTELPERACGLSAGGPVGVATLRPRDQRRGYAARSVNFGGGPARVA